jgi:hypothetical protein
MTLAIRPAGHVGDFLPLVDAPRDGSVVTLRFRDPACPDHEPADRAARFERGHGKVAQWRMCDTHDVLLDRNADGWSAALPDDETLVWADAAHAFDDFVRASQSDLAHDRAKAGSKLPWQIALAAAGQARAEGRA